MLQTTLFALIWISFVAGGTALSILTIDNHSEHVHEDGWGEWSEWLPCSRTCGGGVSYMQRECLRSRSEGEEGPGCIGSNRMYSSCSIQDCPVDSEDFRSLQCADHNNRTHDGRTYEWIPYTGAPNPCELHCQPTSEEFSLKLADKVVDGTRCGVGSLDVCVDGTCESVGCDMLLGSDLKLDVCRECDGNGSSCYLVKNSITAKLPSGYTPLIFIPPGATNVHVYERKGSRNLLAVRDSDKRYVLNGQWKVDNSSMISVAGSILEYTRKPNKKRSPEHVKIAGPTMEMIYIDVLVQDRNRGIEYEFYLPRGMEDPNRMEHEWFAEAWNSCTKECGAGLQKRRVVCKNNDGERVLKYLCNARERPSQTRKCNVHPCETRWQSGKWNACSQTCGRGVQTRQVNCIQMPEQIDGAPLLLTDSRCEETSERPETHRVCGEAACPDWDIGEWSPCTTTCGAGVQVREVRCPSSNGCNSSLIPPRQKDCNPGPCEGNEWVASDWSKCVGACGEGVQSREVSCIGRDRRIYPGIMCDMSQRPPLLQQCHADSLCPDSARWWTEEWGECSATCGIGIQTRRVICAIFDIGTYRTLPDSNCDHAARPAKKQECNIRNCTARWRSGAWAPCSVSCLGGVRTRVVTCIGASDVILDDDSCIADPKPATEEDCNRVSCTDVEAAQPPLENTPDCQLTTYGCCPDGFTAAIGPREEGCEIPACENTLYGCCPDGQQRALGEYYQGCPGTNQIATDTRRENGATDDVTRDDGREPTVDERCRQRSDPGHCIRWEVRWFFDTSHNRCDRFWFGGCGGNYNRFNSKEECARVCGQFATTQDHATNNPPRITPNRFPASPQPPSLPTTTTTPPSHATRDDSFSPELDIIPDSDRRRPAGHDDRNDVTHDVTHDVRPEQHSRPTLCFLRKSSGPCDGRYHRWYFDGATGTCASFWYGGCGGNENNFASQATCAHICGNKPLPTFDNGLEEENSPPVPVTIKPGRTEVFAQAGKMARLACMADGYPKPTVTWHRLGRRMAENDRIEILDDHSLIVSKIVPEDAGTYECVARNDRGPDQSWKVKLVVKDRVLISETPSDSTITEGSTAALRCRIQDDVLFVTWYKGNEKVVNDEFYNIQPWGDLHILQAEIEDSGEYTCTAYASDASQSASAVLTVIEEDVHASQPPTAAPRLPLSRAPVVTQQRRRPNSLTVRECRDYPEYANCNVVVLKQMCHKHDYIRYCCASCGGSAQAASSRRLVKRHRSQR